jgi:hypothetical protein
MRNFIFCIILLVSVDTNGQQNKDCVNVPDTSINKVFFLLDEISIIKNIGDQRGKLIEDEKPSRVQLKNKTGTQYLILYHLNGANANSFNMFEVGYILRKNETFLDTKFIYFFSQNGIKLGISKNELVKIKGSNYTRKYQNDFEIIKYKIENNQFLQRYNMPIYISEYHFKDDKLVKFIFGLPNW